VASLLAAGLPARGVQTSVALQRDGRTAANLRDAGVAVHVVPEILETLDRSVEGARSPLAIVRNVCGLPRAVRALRAIAIRHGASLLYSHGSWPHHLAAEATRGWASGRPGAVWHVHTAFSRANGVAARVMARRGDVRAIVAVSESAAAPYARLGPPVDVVYNGVDLEAGEQAAQSKHLRHQLSIADDAFIFGYAGRLVAHKGIYVLADAALEVLRAVSGAHFVLLGGNPPGLDVIGPLRQRFDESGVGNRVHLTGYVDDVVRWMAGFDVAVVPSTYADPCPLALLEALSAGVPVVASKIGGIPELVENGRSGWLVTPGNAPVLAAALKQLSTDPAARRAAGAAARAEAMARFDERRTIDRVASILKRAASGTPRSSDPPRDPT